MLESILHQNRFLLRAMQSSVAELDDARLAEQPLPGMNHPAWILGHLAWAADEFVGVLGGAKQFDGAWKQRYGVGSTPTSMRGDYASKQELLAALEERYEESRRMLTAATPEQLSEPTTNARMKENLPTLGDRMAFVLTGHLGIHLGQLSAWRRAIGIPPRF